MNDVVIVEAVRSPVGRRNGGLSTSHSVDLLGTVQKALFERSGVDPSEVGQVVGGCVGQVGMQSMNVTRTRSEERRVGKECRSRWSPYH